jgi:hypothetical protein
LQEFEEGRFAASGSIHVACAGAYFGTTDLIARIRRTTPDLDDASAAEIQKLLDASPLAAAGQPTLAKTSGETEASATSERKTAG